jgi:hypothetical protein
MDGSTRAITFPTMKIEDILVGVPLNRIKYFLYDAIKCP